MGRNVISNAVKWYDFVGSIASIDAWNGSEHLRPQPLLEEARQIREIPRPN